MVKESYYDEPTRIMEIMKDDPEEYGLLKWYQEFIMEKVGKENIREFSRKRWMEFMEEHKYQPSPEQKQYALTDWKKIEEKYFGGDL